MKRTILVLMMLCAALTFLWPLDARLLSAETTVVVRPDGKADVFYLLEWEVRDGEMHGFYFEGTAAAPVFNLDLCWADLPSLVRIPLEIKNLGSGRFDVLLAQGKGFSGTAHFHLSYGADLSSAGLIGRTISADLGDLFAFDWAPVIWDYPLDHKTVTVVLPMVVERETFSFQEAAELGLRTEPYVNEENRIDYSGSLGSDGKLYFTIRFHQENAPPYRSMRLQFYLPLETAGFQDEALPQLPEASTSRPLASDRSEDKSPLKDLPILPQAKSFLKRRSDVEFSPVSIYLAAMLVILLLLYWRKDRGYAKVVEGVEGIKWAGDDWTPPQLVVGTYQTPGKIAEDLHPVEAALLLEMPLPAVVGILVDGLEAQGIIRTVKLNPLQIEILTAEKAKHPLEERFLACFSPDGKVLSGLLADFFEEVISGLQEKIWDCDINVTKKHYRGIVESFEEEEKAGRITYMYP